MIWISTIIIWATVILASQKNFTEAFLLLGIGIFAMTAFMVTIMMEKRR